MYVGVVFMCMGTTACDVRHSSPSIMRKAVLRVKILLFLVLCLWWVLFMWVLLLSVLSFR